MAMTRVRKRLTRKRVIVLLSVAALMAGMMFLGWHKRDWVWVTANSFNPMLLAFLEDFTIVNESGTDLTIMPIGMVEGTGRYGPLPRYDRSTVGARPVAWRKTLHLAAGEAVKIVYDYDDINFRHILVMDGAGNCYNLDTDKRGTTLHCYGPQQTRYTIPPVTELGPTPKELMPAFHGRAVPYSGARSYP